MDEKAFQSRLELLTRAGAIGVVLLYGVGFIIISLHRGSYGIVQSELFRAKVLSAGIVFVVFLFLPFIVASKAYGLLGYKTAWSPAIPRASTLHYCSRFVGTLEFILEAAAMALMMRGLLEYDGQEIRVFAGFLFAFTFFAVILIRGRFQAAPRSCAVLAVLGISLVVVGTVQGEDTNTSALTLWFVIAGSSALLVNSLIENSTKLRDLDWPVWLMGTVALSSLFALAIYPRIKPSLGGGAPVSIVLEFPNKSAINGARRMRVWLIDETDNGFYVIRSRDEQRAIFLPRSSVSTVYFGEPLASLSDVQSQHSGEERMK